MKVGVLAVQGDFEAHRAMLNSLGLENAEIRSLRDLDGLDAVVLPGGESSTQLKFLQEEGLLDPLRRFGREGGAIFGTCAGAILLASQVLNPPQDSLGLMDITVLRNGYGRQLSSEVRTGASSLSPAPLEMVFIRAPIIERAGAGVEVLARDAGRPVLVRQGNLLAATFHPELTADSTVYSYFLGLIPERVRAV